MGSIFIHMFNRLISAATEWYRPLKVTQGRSFWYQSNVHMQLPISPSL